MTPYATQQAQEKKDQRETLRYHWSEIAHELSKITNEKWHLVPLAPDADPFFGIHRLNLQGPGNHRLHVSAFGKRYEVSGDYPRDNRNSYLVYTSDNAPRITQSKTRAAGALALDISRRVLPAYRKLHDEIVKRIVELDRNFTKKDDLAEKIALILETKPHSMDHNAEPTVYGPDGAKFRMVSADTVYVDLRCSPIVAQRIAMIIADQ